VRPRYLIDKSALARMPQEPVRQRLAPIIEPPLGGSLARAPLAGGTAAGERFPRQLAKLLSPQQDNLLVRLEQDQVKISFEETRVNRRADLLKQALVAISLR
jgi:hypothetical protein